MGKMQENINRFKGSVSAVLAVLTALWGWFGWLIVAWIVSMALDVATGMTAAMRRGEWSSRVAREGCWHKLGEIVAVMVAGILDLVMGVILGNLPTVELPFVYTVLLCPLVVVWYILTEAGSITENAGKLGAPVPKWLKKAIAAFQSKLDEEREEGNGNAGGEPE